MIAVRLGMATGMRKGEVLGLDWAAVDLKRKKLMVVQQYTQKKKLKKPKSVAGVRVLSLDDETIEFLGQWKVEQSSILAANEITQTENTPVVCDNFGKRIDPIYFTKWFQKFCAQHGYGSFKVVEPYLDSQGKYRGWKRTRRSGYEGLCFHELRHTQATLLIANHCDIKTVQHRLGHSDVETTLNIYSHFIEANDESAAQTIAALYR